MKGENPKSGTKEKYLEAVFRLERENGSVRVTDLAEDLGLLKGSVSGALRNLKALGLIDTSPYRSIELTDAGRRIAETIDQRNRALSLFLCRVLELPADESEKAARRMGPAVPETLIERIGELVEEPCPEDNAPARRFNGGRPCRAPSGEDPEE